MLVIRLTPGPVLKCLTLCLGLVIIRHGVGCAFGWGLRLSIRLDGFVGRLIFVADGSPHRSEVPGAQPLEASSIITRSQGEIETA
jgi:hypothetical protein